METVIQHLTMKGFTRIDTDIEEMGFRRGKVTVFLGDVDCWAVIPLNVTEAELDYLSYEDGPNELNRFLNAIIFDQ